MKIDLLYFDGCPSWLQALENLKAAIKEEHLDASVQIIQVTSAQEATDHRFLGSPSFQVDGVDFWPITKERFFMSCRVYATSEGLKGWPSVAILRQKLREKETK
jgi:hypothetical protein